MEKDFDIEAMKRSALEATEFLKKFGNEDRLLLICYLCQGEHSVSELEHLTGIYQPTLSQQLAVLRNDGLVETRRDGRRIYYRVEDPKVRTLLESIYLLFGPNRED